jgi:D-amino-acid dehydrogenase
MNVVIIGAGVVGLASAYALHKAGAGVVVVERREGPALETSFGNGALQHPGLVEPWNSPGVGWDLLRWIGRDDAPILLHLGQVPALAFWGLKFLANSAPKRFETNALKNLRLALLSRREMTAMREDTRVSDHCRKTGTLVMARAPTALEAAKRHAELFAPHGITFRALNREEVVGAEPALAPIASAIAGGVFYPEDERGDSHVFCNEMTKYLQGRGVTFLFETDVTGFKADKKRLRAVDTAAGDIEADAFVMAAGSFSPGLLSPLKINLPVRPAKGYSATLLAKGNPHAPKMPVSDSALHAAVVPIGDDRVRVAGTAEFAGFDTEVRAARVNNLRSLMSKIYPKLSESVRAEDYSSWAGFRPLSCDGVPTISRTKIENLYLNTGHGHIGWTTAAGSARLLADLVFERTPALAAGDYSIGRF